MPTSIVIELKNDRAELVRLAGELQTFASAHALPADKVGAVDLALDEIVTNIIAHGYPGGGSHTIRLQLDLSDGELRIVVEDDGLAFNPLEAKAPDVNAPLEARPIGGLGIHLVRSLMDELTYERRGPHNVLSLKKRLI